MNDVLSPPPPFDDMMVMPSKGTTGCRFTFCLTSSGKCVGYDFPKGYCIRNYDLSYPYYRHEIDDRKIYFLECRNIIKKQNGLLAAMIPIKLYRELSKKKSTDEEILFSCDLVVVDGLVHDVSSNSFFVNLHIPKKNMFINGFAAEPNIHQAIPHYFNASSAQVKN